MLNLIFALFLSHSIKVVQQILILSVEVRILVGQLPLRVKRLLALAFQRSLLSRSRLKLLFFLVLKNLSFTDIDIEKFFVPLG